MELRLENRKLKNCKKSDTGHKGKAPWWDGESPSDLAQSERGLSGVSEAIGGPGKVPEEGIDIVWVVSAGVSLFLLQEGLQLLEGHVLLVLTVAAKLLSKLQDSTVRTAQSGQQWFRTDNQDSTVRTAYLRILHRSGSGTCGRNRPPPGIQHGCSQSPVRRKHDEIEDQMSVHVILSPLKHMQAHTHTLPYATSW